MTPYTTPCGPIYVNRLAQAATRDQVAERYLRDALERWYADAETLSVPHPVAIPSKGWTPQSGGAQEVAHVRPEGE